ncbi:MAG: glycosyltransferase [Raoultibacter sp.]
MGFGAATISGVNTAPKVSILVPCFNVERFLPQCLESLINQTLKEIEIICINDGSTDSTLAIIQNYAAQDARIVVIDKQNSGYGASMNAGLACAKGEYVGITESDDFASRSMFKTLYSWAHKKDCDLVKSNYFEYEAGRDHRKKTFAGKPYRKVFDPACYPDALCTVPTIWAAIYRRSLLESYGVKFRETPGASFQDTAFVLKCWFCARRVLLLPQALLHYRIDNPDSSVKSSTKIFEVCDEFEAADHFMRSDPPRRARFTDIFFVHMFNTYRWNYNRVSREFHEPLAKRMAEDFAQAQKKGELKRSLFGEDSWALLQNLLGDSQAFASKYGDGF